MPGKRSPTAHRTPAQIRHHGDTYQATTEQKKNRAKRNAARADAMDKGMVHKGDGMDVDHKRPMSKGGTNAASNLRVTSAHKNRGHGMTDGKKPNKGR